MSVTLEDESVATIEEALKAADNLITAVVSGKPGQIQLALGVSRLIAEIKRKRIVKL